MNGISDIRSGNQPSLYKIDWNKNGTQNRAQVLKKSAVLPGYTENSRFLQEERDSSGDLAVGVGKRIPEKMAESAYQYRQDQNNPLTKAGYSKTLERQARKNPIQRSGKIQNKVIFQQLMEGERENHAGRNTKDEQAGPRMADASVNGIEDQEIK